MSFLYELKIKDYFEAAINLILCSLQKGCIWLESNIKEVSQRLSISYDYHQGAYFNTCQKVALKFSCFNVYDVQ